MGDRYERGGVTAFDARDPVKRGDAVTVTVEASLGLLSAGDQARYRDLSVFPPGQPVPFDVIADWWASALERDETEDLLTSLAKYALLTLDWGTETVRLHDVLRAYLLPREPGRAAALHRRLIGNWGDPLEQDGHRTRWYAYHLALGGESERLYALIIPAWRDHVLAATGALSDLQADVLRAADCARQQRNLPQELRCRLIAASLAAEARALPGPLLRLLVRLGEVDRALGYATLLIPRYSSLALKDVAVGWPTPIPIEPSSSLTGSAIRHPGGWRWRASPQPWSTQISAGRCRSSRE